MSEENKCQSIQEAGAFVTRGSDSFLALVTNDSYWSLPKGHIEQGEIPSEAAIRETLEETHIEAGSQKIIKSFQFQHKGYTYNLVIYHATYISGIVFYDEHPDTEARWLSFREAKKIKPADSNYLDVLEIVEKNMLDGCGIELPYYETSELNEYFGNEVELLLLSSRGAKRPVFQISGTDFTARYMESEKKAIRAEIAVSYMNFDNKPIVFHVGHWLFTSLINGVSLDRSYIDESTMKKVGNLLGQINSSSVPIDVQEKHRESAIEYIDKKGKESIDKLLVANFLTQDEANLVSVMFSDWGTEFLPSIAICPQHWDFVPGNVFETEQGVSVIDYEGSRLFFVGYDFVKASYNFTSSPEGERSFVESYKELMPVLDERHLHYMEIFYLVRVLANRLSRPILEYRILYQRLKKVLNNAELS